MAHTPHTTSYRAKKIFRRSRIKKKARPLSVRRQLARKGGMFRMPLSSKEYNAIEPLVVLFAPFTHSKISRPRSHATLRLDRLTLGPLCCNKASDGGSSTNVHDAAAAREDTGKEQNCIDDREDCSFACKKRSAIFDDAMALLLQGACGVLEAAEVYGDRTRGHLAVDKVRSEMAAPDSGTQGHRDGNTRTVIYSKHQEHERREATQLTALTVDVRNRSAAQRTGSDVDDEAALRIQLLGLGFRLPTIHGDFIETPARRRILRRAGRVAGQRRLPWWRPDDYEKPESIMLLLAPFQVLKGNSVTYLIQPKTAGQRLKVQCWDEQDLQFGVATADTTFKVEKYVTSAANKQIQTQYPRWFGNEHVITRQNCVEYGMSPRLFGKYGDLIGFDAWYEEFAPS